MLGLQELEVVFGNTDKGGRGFYRWMDRDVEVEIVIYKIWGDKNYFCT